MVLIIGEFDLLKISVVIMLVNINDVFIGFNVIDVFLLVVNELLFCISFFYDVGIEVNFEVVGIIFGLVDLGEGFNEMWDDINWVVMYLGVVI